MDGEAAYKFDATKRDKYLELLASGLRRGAAAKAVGVHRSTVRDHYNHDAAFAAACDQAEMDACDLVEDALFRQAVTGNVTAIQVWLYNRHRDRWKDQRNLGKLSAIEELLAKLPAEHAQLLRQLLADPVPGASGDAPADGGEPPASEVSA